MATTVTLQAQELTSEAFAPYGQVIQVQDDMKPYGPNDAQLDLSQGLPRFYMLRLNRRSLEFDRITYHAKVTQCLAAASTDRWYMAVASPGTQPPLKPDDLLVFRVPPATILKLDKGTWHAGPLFDHKQTMDFYNLELSDTNVNDHTTYFFKNDKIQFIIEDNLAPLTN